MLVYLGKNMMNTSQGVDGSTNVPNSKRAYPNSISLIIIPCPSHLSPCGLFRPVIKRRACDRWGAEPWQASTGPVFVICLQNNSTCLTHPHNTVISHSRAVVESPVGDLAREVLRVSQGRSSISHTFISHRFSYDTRTCQLRRSSRRSNSVSSLYSAWSLRLE